MGTLSLPTSHIEGGGVREQLKQVIDKADKKVYEVVIGKLNEPKILNFTSVDLFVVLA